MVVFDSSFLLLAVHPHAPAPDDPSTGRPIEKGRSRVEHLINTLSDARSAVLIPTPVLAEVYVLAGAPAVAEFDSRIRKISSIEIVDFDRRAAIECAMLTGAALKTGKKRGTAANDAWQKVKVDRQIIAIAKCAGANAIYTCDKGLRALALAERFTVYHLADLPLPPIDAQNDMFQPSED